MDIKRNNSTGEKYITNRRNLFIVRIKKEDLLEHWSSHHTLEEALEMRNKLVNGIAILQK